MSTYQSFCKSVQSFETFPQNIVKPAISKHHLEAFYRRLNEHEKRLFCRDGQASVDLWDFHDEQQAFRNALISTEIDLEEQISGGGSIAKDPRSRFFFIHARHSRDRLRISREMLAFVFTYHQVMPSFLDFIFPFGHQQYAEDFYFSGFREDTRLSVLDGGLQILELGRSGRELRVCYSLKSVEPIPNADDNAFHWPWSVRQTALYTSFDIVTGKSFWTIIKGNHLIRDRIQSASDANSIETTASAFISVLDTHLVLCEWCVEDWRWYLSFLEKKLQQLTRRALAVDMSGISTFVESSFQNQEKLPTTSITRGFSDISKRHFTFSRRQSGISPQIQQEPKFPLQALPERLENPVSNIPPQLPPVLPPGMGGPMQRDFEDLDDVVSVGALQKVQHIEDKATEVLLAITSNIKVVENIRDHYQKAFSAILEDCPLDFQEQCNARMKRFIKRIFNVLGDLNMGRDSAEILLSLINRRRELLSGLLDIRNIEASQRVAREAQYSAKKMEAMTESMHQIAIKTKQETVSMRIITLVTLFFLPGTFISTIMSTDIISFQTTQESGKVFQLGALQLYLAITIPMMAITFAAWGVVYRCINRRESESSRSNSSAVGA